MSEDGRASERHGKKDGWLEILHPVQQYFSLIKTFKEVHDNKRCVQVKGVMFMFGKNSTSWIATQNTKFQLKTSSVFRNVIEIFRTTRFLFQFYHRNDTR